MYRIVQIYYDKESKANCYDHPNVEKYYNANSGEYFENTIMVSCLGLSKQYDYFGVWSHKHKHKVQGKGFSFEKMEERLTDVLAFQRFLRNGRIFSGDQEKTYKELFNRLMEFLKIKYRFPNKPKFIVMQNHFIARSDIFRDYINTVLWPAMRFMDIENGYDQKVEYRGPGVYTYKPFICEKLFSAYLEDKKFDCQHW